MNQPGNLRLILDSDQAEASEPFGAAAPAEPKIFVRTVAAPPGWPWDQRRVAILDARHGAPLPLGEVAMQLRRIESWRPGQAGRYAAFYVRRGDVHGRLETELEVAGQSQRVVFLAPGEHQRVARTLGLAAFATFVVVAVIALSTVNAVLSRGRAEAQLQAAEAAAATKLRQAQAIRASRAQSEALDAVDRGERLDTVLTDLAWASTAKAPGARIEAWRWQGGLMAVEVRGEASPFTATDRIIQKAPKPLRKRVWLWGVGPASRERPVSASPSAAR
ncbi:hypothetical protein ASD79_16020 [Caulobacter sp. Root655]|uniref:hypothetical protein n=1 Tax=Caulobacter sp. Root655 TaxID=1736578 RepID=UPI0006FE7BA3|nr:hypothetical protein [Caulobacter sp. Root655]KRA57819.1 hypothetical protein ASD79_16020 [Caulobacter sp. Root655]